MAPIAQGDTGYIMEVDFHYPISTHKRNNDFPAGPEKIVPKFISPYNANLYSGEAISQKLVAHLDKHNNFVAHYIEIQGIIKQGGIITKIHKILQFKQAAFAQQFVLLNNNRRKEASTRNDEFGKYSSS